MAKGSKKTKSESDKRYFASYNGEKQREKRLNRHMKKHPNDVQSSKAKPVYRRRKPLVKGGWLTRKIASEIYLGKTPGKDDDPANIVNAMSSMDKVKMAQFASMLKATHNRLEYEKEDKSKVKFGFAG